MLDELAVWSDMAEDAGQCTALARALRLALMVRPRANIEMILYAASFGHGYGHGGAGGGMGEGFGQGQGYDNGDGVGDGVADGGGGGVRED